VSIPEFYSFLTAVISFFYIKSDN